MRLSKKRQICSIVARAMPFWDRTLEINSKKTVLNQRVVRRRFERWQEILGGADGLKRRLQSTKLTVRSLKKSLRWAESISEDLLPSWASTLERIWDVSNLIPSVDPLNVIENQIYDLAQPLPFQEVLIGLVLYARECIRTQTNSAFDVLQPQAVLALERQLLAHLTFVASLSLGQDFYNFRFQRAPASVFEIAWQKQNQSTEIYEDYVHRMIDGGFNELLYQYPVLARLFCVSIEQWIEMSSKFCQRFKQDFSDLKTFFGWKAEQPIGAISQLKADLSDRHHGGQTVIECILQSGEHVFYKPRSLRPEIAFYQFISWLNNQGLTWNLKVLQALDRATYGWIESVTCAPCQTVEEVERFYGRAGILLGILHVLGVTDIHCENLIAFGEHPVIVDLETLVNGGLPSPAPKFSVDNNEDYLEKDPSVLNTGLLPIKYTSLHGQKFDMSALGSDGTQDPDIRVLSWQSINTDQMKLLNEVKYEARLFHRVRLADSLPTVNDHLPAFLTGFKEVYFCLLEKRSNLLTDNNLLGNFDNLDLRILIRNTSTYTRLLLHLFHPEFLKDGIDRSIELEWLAKPLSGIVPSLDSRKLLYELERTAMEDLDIPHISTSICKTMKYTHEDKDLWLFFGRHDSHVIRQRLANLSLEDYLKQCAIINDAIKLRFSPK
jgi:type 2 lantibiotic biosynthesis protein LanM